MELIKNFGIDPILLGAQIINFLVILLILRKFLYKPVLDLLKKRQSTIKEGLEKTEEARILLEKTVEDEKKVLEKASIQAKKIIEDAKNHSQNLARQIEENAKVQTYEMIKGAYEQIKKEARETEKRLTLNITGVATKILEKSLENFFSEKEQKNILQNALKKIKKYD